MVFAMASIKSSASSVLTLSDPPWSRRILGDEVVDYYRSTIMQWRQGRAC